MVIYNEDAGTVIVTGYREGASFLVSDVAHLGYGRSGESSWEMRIYLHHALSAPLRVPVATEDDVIDTLKVLTGIALQRPVPPRSLLASEEMLVQKDAALPAVPGATRGKTGRQQETP